MIIMNINTDKSALIDIGRQGEHGVRQVWFDLSYLIENFGDGTALLVNQRPMDSAPYMVTTEQNGNTLVWTIGETDTAYEGFGKLEIRWTVNNDLAKTVVYRTMTAKSLTGDSQVPDPYQSWYDELIDYIDEHSISPEELGQAIEDYIEEHPISAPVQSVNSKTGAVVLTASDVGALPDSTTIPTKVSQLQNDSGFGTYSKPSGGIPKSDLASAVQTSLGKADSALQSAPVTSVNNKTGAVTLNASDVGAGTYSKPSGGIPSSDMASAVQTSLGKADSAYQKPSGGIPETDLSSAVQTSLGKADSALQSAPVSSVNSKTGAVTLAAGDIGYDDSATYASGSVGAEITSLMGDLSNIQTATSDDIGKALSPKTVSSGTVTEWQYVNAGGGGGSAPSPYTSNPSALGTASAGSSNDYARGDHVHPKPTASDLGITVPSASSATPQALGTAAAGSSSDYSRADHVHAMPTAANVGAIALPSNPSTNDFLVFNGSAWVAQSLSTWQGGSY